MFNFDALSTSPVSSGHFALLSDILEAIPGASFGSYIPDAGIESMPVFLKGKIVGFVS